MSDLLKKVLEGKLEVWKKTRSKLSLDLALSKVVTSGNLLSGMRGVPTRVSYTSRVEPKGLFYSNVSIETLFDSSNLNTLPELVFLLFLTGEAPEDLLIDYIVNRMHVKKNQGIGLEVYELVERMAESPPIDMLIMAFAAMNAKSACNIVKAYSLEGERWKPVLDDAVDALAKLPRLVGAIAGARKGQGTSKVRFNYWSNGTLGEAFANYLGLNGPEAGEFMSLILGLHACHETGPASTNSALIASNAWSPLYLSLAAGFCALAGERHGGANDKALNQIESAFLFCQNDCKKLQDFYENAYNEGVLFGFGHPVYEVIDPRYVLIKKFLERKGVESKLLNLVYSAEKVVPSILGKKTKKCYPNIDLISGPALQAYGLTDYDMMPVIFASGRIIGMMSNIIVALMFKDSLDRPSTPYYNRLTGELK